MIDAIQPDPALVDLLLCAADVARAGVDNPLLVVWEWMECDHALVVAARYELMFVAPRGAFYRGDLLADTMLEAAYRVSEGRGASTRLPSDESEAA